MTFSNYKTISEVLKTFKVINTGDNFISEMTFTISHYFHEDLELMIWDTVVDNSELLIHEHLIYCVLKEVWKAYRQHFVLSSCESLNHDEKLLGSAKCVLAKRYPLGKVVFDKPTLSYLKLNKITLKPVGCNI
jgi:hypothetical protein